MGIPLFLRKKALFTSHLKWNEKKKPVPVVCADTYTGYFSTLPEVLCSGKDRETHYAGCGGAFAACRPGDLLQTGADTAESV